MRIPRLRRRYGPQTSARKQSGVTKGSSRTKIVRGRVTRTLYAVVTRVVPTPPTCRLHKVEMGYARRCCSLASVSREGRLRRALRASVAPTPARPPARPPMLKLPFIKAEGTEGEAESRLLRKLLKNQNRLIDSIRLMDVDRDGVISTAEFRAAIIAMNVGLTDRQVENLIRSIDVDNDGELDMQVECFVVGTYASNLGASQTNDH